jgi:Spy/CpxP family protein refolding chaperone
MKHLKHINEKNNDIINHCFHFLVYSSGHKDWQDKFNKGVEFLKSLNLTDDQYKKLGELMELYEDFVREREDDRRSDDEYFNRFRE